MAVELLPPRALTPQRTDLDVLSRLDPLVWPGPAPHLERRREPLLAPDISATACPTDERPVHRANILNPQWRYIGSPGGGGGGAVPRRRSLPATTFVVHGPSGARLATDTDAARGPRSPSVVPFETTSAASAVFLALSARMRSDTTRRLRDGVLTVALEADSSAALARVHQRPDGALAVSIEGEQPEAALAKLRFVLAVDDDHEPFLRRFVDDPLIGRAVRRLRGLRPLRTATVTHALLKAVCGQLIQARAARDLEARLLRRSATPCGGLLLPPTRTTFGGSSPSHLAREGLVAARPTPHPLSREWDVERLHGVETAHRVARIERERGSAMVGGRRLPPGARPYEHGLVGDLGLIKLCAALLAGGRRRDTRKLLEPYGNGRGWRASTCSPEPRSSLER